MCAEDFYAKARHYSSIVFLSITCVVVLIVTFTKFCRTRADKLSFPHPPEVTQSYWRRCPFIGDVPALGLHPHRNLLEFAQRVGSIGVIALRLGKTRAVVINGSKSVRACAERSRGSGAASADPAFTRRSPLGDRPDFDAYRHYAAGRSISFARSGPGHSSHRRVAAAAISKLLNSPERLAERVIGREADTLTADWKRRQQTGFDPAESVQRAVGAALYSMCYGVDEHLVEDDEYCRLLLEENLGTELFAIGKQPDLFARRIRHFITDDRKQRKHFRRMSTHVRLNDEKIRRLKRHQGNEKGNDNEDSVGSCIVDSAADEWRRQASKLRSVGLTREHLLGLPVEFLSAGSETSTATILWLLRLIVLHTDVQDRVHRELDTQLADEEPLSFRDRYRLPFTEAVILEAARLFPVVPLGLPHYVQHESHLDLSSDKGDHSKRFTLPAGTIIYNNLWSTGRDPRAWINPDKFDPDRFLVNVDRGSSFEQSVSGEVGDHIAEQTKSASNTPTQSASATLSASDTKATESRRPSTGSTATGEHGRCIENDLESIEVTVSPADIKLVVNRKLVDQCCPFGVGRRRCVGEPLGRVQVFLIFATLMRSLRVELVSPPVECQRDSSALRETFGDVVRPIPFDIRAFKR